MKLVIFDVDGTLVDSQDTIVETQRRAFTALGLPVPSREQSLSIVGLSLPEAFAALIGRDGLIAELSEAYRAVWQDMRQDPDFHDPLYPGAAALIAQLHARTDVTLGIATGKSMRGVDHLIHQTGWHGHFATIQTSDDNPSKPDPGMVLRALTQTGISPHNAVMVGDTSFDMEMGRAAGVATIGCLWGYHPHARLKSAGAQHLVADFAALEAVLTPFLAGATHA